MSSKLKSRSNNQDRRSPGHSYRVKHSVKHFIKHSGQRTAGGASLFLVIFASLALIALVYGIFQLYLILGGSREVRNAVDAGALNLSTKVFQLRVPADPAYADVADSNGQIGMSNINRVWGKAYLINANVQQMQQDGQMGQYAQGNAESAYQAAQNLNDQLFAAVSCRNSQGNLFNQVAAAKQAKLLSGDTTVTKDPNATNFESPLASIAYVDRGDESNLSFNPLQIPKSAQVQGVTQGNNHYIAGYVPMQANNKQFHFTSFHNNEMPHLISQSVFDANRADKSALGVNVIPNAFKIDGSVQATQGSLGAVACAVANPQRQYRLAIPHAFISIHFINRANWYVEGVQVRQTVYENKPLKQFQGVKKKKLSSGGTLDGFANLGNEYPLGGSLWQIYTSLPGDHQTPLQKILQRVQEIDPDFTLARLTSLMESCISHPAVQSYYIFPTYTTPDCSDPTIHIQPADGQLPAWLVKAGLDGTSLPVSTENKTEDAPNTCYDYIEGPPNSDKHYTEVSGTITWAPGSGYGQCLGSLHMNRVTDIYFTGKP